MKRPVEHIEVPIQELRELLTAAREKLGAEGYSKLKAAIDTLAYLTSLIEDQQTTIQKLRELLVKPASSEKTDKVLEKAGLKTEVKDIANGGTPKKAKKGHGRNGAGAYSGAHRVPVTHASLSSGNNCPKCLEGKLYAQRDPGVLLRITGRAPIEATIYELEKLRCGLCQEVFTATAPPEAGDKKYDEKAASAMALLKYGRGVPFYRLDQMQRNLGIPLPPSTQWGIVKQRAELIRPAIEELIRQAAQGKVLYNDDTKARVLALRREQPETGDDRTGVFTSGIVATTQGWKAALYFTGRQHAGENLADVLKWRAGDLSPPIQMSDALSRNTPKRAGLKKILTANCNAHGRRQFVEIASSFPEQCRYVLESFRAVYHNDALAEEQNLSAEERLRFHQEHSDPVLKELHRWMEAQFTEHKTEPNSGLGKAISYLLRHWVKLTLFLREPGAPLDANIVERALKKAILHRKNGLFYKTLNGAGVGDLFMSLIHTCELNEVNSFEYLTELQRHSAELSARPSEWMPWNYRAALARLTISAA
ncbi:MAG: IS66 family transposase [Acidobacteriia bacterium]|nr:IS66 family transposase [Terriglobia bacterium]